MTFRIYLFKRLIKSFLFIFFVICFLYILIDYSTRASFFRKLSRGELSFFITFYLAHISAKLTIFIPFASLIASVSVASQLAYENELTALMAQGISKTKIASPFCLLGVFLTLLLFINQELFFPSSQLFLNQTKDKKEEVLLGGYGKKKLNVYTLKDGSRFFFTQYDPSEKVYSEVFWVSSQDMIWYFSTLESCESVVGRRGHLFKRDDEGILRLTKSVEEATDLNIPIQKGSLPDIPPSERSLRKLYKETASLISPQSEKEAQISASFFKKLVTPTLALLCMLAPLPFALQFSRRQRIFFLYSGGLFSLVAYIVLMNAMEVLASRQIIKPLYAILIPALTIFISVIRRHSRLSRV